MFEDVEFLRRIAQHRPQRVGTYLTALSCVPGSPPRPALSPPVEVADFEAMLDVKPAGTFAVSRSLRA
jgi:hypothetical protein